MVNKQTNKYDGQIHDRTWIQINQTQRPKEAIYKTLIQGRHNKLQNANRKNASAIYVQGTIDDEFYEWLTVYPNSEQVPHQEINDYFAKNSFHHIETDPLCYFITNTEESNYISASTYDTHPRAPLEVSKGLSNNSSREHTIAHDIQYECRKSNYDHLVATIIRPLVIRDRDTKIKNTASLENKIGRILQKLLIDRRSEGKVSSEHYYVQLIEVIAQNNDQQRPDTPAIVESINWSADKHNFNVEFIPINHAIKKLRRAQTDVRSSRIRWFIPGIDYKKRAFAVSKSNLRQFTTGVVDKDGHR